MTDSIHPILSRAAYGGLPDWACIGPRRREHIDGVVALLDRWSASLRLSSVDRRRWRATAFLHDALRDADPTALHGAEAWPPELRHGPAVALRLEEAGIEDREILEAIRYHTVGWAGWGELGRFLYLADFLEPGRSFAPARTAALRAQLPAEVDGVLSVVCAWRLGLRLRWGVALRPESVEFYNSLVEEE